MTLHCDIKVEHLTTYFYIIRAKNNLNRTKKYYVTPRSLSISYTKQYLFTKYTSICRKVTIHV